MVLCKACPKYLELLHEDKNKENVPRGEARGEARGGADTQERNLVIGNVTIDEIIKYCKTPRTRTEIQEFCGLISKRSFNENHMKPMIAIGILKMTIPDKPTSQNQKYYS